MSATLTIIQIWYIAMKKLLRSTLLLAAVVLVSVFAVACDTPSELQDGTLSGVVQEAGTATPLPDITVTLDNLETTTDQNGRFTFQNVPVGQTMTLLVIAPGFDRYTRRIDVEGGENSFDISLVRTPLFNLQFNHRAIQQNAPTEGVVPFYNTILGFESLESPFGPGTESCCFFAIGDHQELHVAPGNNNSIDKQKALHMAYSTQDFDAYLSFLTDNGIDYGNFAGESGAVQTRPDGVKQVYLQDPGGNWIEVNNVRRTQSINLQFEHASILASDLESSAAFYKNILQFQELETPFGADEPVRFLAIRDHQELHLTLGERSNSLTRNKTLRIAFAVQDFDAYLGFLSDNEIDYENLAGISGAIQIRPDGARLVYIQDPDGNWIQINDED